MNEHQGRPSEAWMRDLIFDNPWPIIREFCQSRNRPLNLPKNVQSFREFQVPGGACDLLFAWEGRALVVEMKRDFIDENAIAQCMRYVGAIEYAYGVICFGVVCAPSITTNARYALHAYQLQSGFGISYMQFHFSYTMKFLDPMLQHPNPDARDQSLSDIVYPYFEDEGEDDADEDPSLVEQVYEIVEAARVARDESDPQVSQDQGSIS